MALCSRLNIFADVYQSALYLVAVTLFSCFDEGVERVGDEARLNSEAYSSPKLSKILEPIFGYFMRTQRSVLQAIDLIHWHTIKKSNKARTKLETELS